LPGIATSLDCRLTGLWWCTIESLRRETAQAAAMARAFGVIRDSA